MIEIDELIQPDRGQPAASLELVDKAGFESWMKSLAPRVRQAAQAQRFKAEGYQLAILPAEKDGWSAALGVADTRKLSPWCLAKAAETLPQGSYRLASASPGPAMLGWILGQYRFDLYRERKDVEGPRVLLVDDPARIDENLSAARATMMVRDMVNQPAAEMGPAAIQDKAEQLAGRFGAEPRTTIGTALDTGFPMVAAVGAAAAEGREPRLVEIVWGDQRHPRLALVGKGVCFDSGGLDIKPAAGMRLMKKDMGGAAHVLGLAGMIMEAKLPVRLHVVIPAVENSISGSAFRPGDILRSRKGLTVEVGNTDAEGRLILADALTLAVENEPQLLIDFATLTGAARIALGPDLPAMFANDDELANGLLEAGEIVTDPVWRMPLWSAYQEQLASDIADLGNVAESPLAGAVTAALFLQRFVPEGLAWAHLDTFAWRPAARPGRPKGGDAQGMRAAFQYLRSRFAA